MTDQNQETPLGKVISSQREFLVKDIIRKSRFLTISSEQPLLKLDHLSGQSYYA
tara:strand:- start:19 stop:180 length:162 start_codon:yes stop_codon:yes gene_type:complete